MFKQIAYTTFVRVIAGVINLIIAIILSNYIGADGKGIQSLILATITIFVLLTGVVGYGGLTFLLPRYNFSTLIVPSYVWSLFSVVIMGFIAVAFNLIPEVYIKHVITLALINSCNHINNSILQVKKRIKEINHMALIQILCLLLFLFILMVIFKIRSINVYIISLYISYLVHLFIGYFYAWQYYKGVISNLNIREIGTVLKKHFFYGGANQLNILAQLLTFRFAYYYINFYMDTSSVGIYSNGVSIIESIWILSRSIAFVLHSRVVNSDNKEYTVRLTIQFIKLSLLLAIFSVAVLVLIPSSFYQYLFGDEFAGMRTVILALSPGVLFLSVSFIINSYFSGVGKHYINMISSIIGLLIIIALSIVFIPAWGIAGAGLAASATYFCVSLIRVVSFYKMANVSVKYYMPSIKDFENIKTSIKELFL